MQYLLDSTALWRMLRSQRLADRWSEDVESGEVASCAPQRIEFRRSARSLAEFDEMTAMFTDLYPDAAVPKTSWRWIDAAQFHLASHRRQRALSVVDWLICAIAAHHALVVIHDDNDFAAAATVLPDLRERNVHDVP